MSILFYKNKLKDQVFKSEEKIMKIPNLIIKYQIKLNKLQ